MYILQTTSSNEQKDYAQKLLFSNVIKSRVSRRDKWLGCEAAFCRQGGCQSTKEENNPPTIKSILAGEYIDKVDKMI